MTVSDWGMIYGSNIFLITRLFYHLNVCILLSSFKSKSIKVSLRYNDLFEKLKFIIQDKTGIPFDSIKLFLNNWELNDNEAFIDSNIEPKSIITAKVRY